MADKKEHMNIVFIGHVDHGKSTTVGRLLFDSKNIDEQAMRKLTDLAKELGKPGFEFAYVMDHLKEERERGVTIDLAHKKFDTPKYYFTIIDAPGHRDFVKNMITGASQADAAVVVCAVTDGIMAQTREHVFLSRTLGVGQIIIGINQMDMVNFDQKRYDAVKKDMSDLLRTVGYDPAKIQFIPMAGLKGDNVFNRSTNTPWYTGPTLYEALDLLSVPEKPTSLALRLPIQDIYNIKGIGIVAVGKVETGILKQNDKVMIVPARNGTGLPAEVKSIEMHHENMPQAGPGDNVGFNLKGVEKKDVARGDVMGPMSNPPSIVTEFTAQIIVLNHPTVLTVGYTPVFHIHTSQVACQIIEIVKKLDPKTGATLAEHPDFLKSGDAAIIKVKPVQPVVIEKKADFPQMARFAVRDSGATVAAGMCIDLVKKN
jgi:elongation factor 1-alpha